ncbi:MBL fold metallo-hydrolase [Streptomyces sp. 4503]|uniref:MBL fold metallo-hydrolase n=1 Tax=Streptomyces niphimycinicus TaxID=2842201 RepID=A0ABS6CJA0_9ACTN|nr:MBL fold metallo-hydrolase [Streptomyces niphimycinicus]MBU3867009.1 MBL fold metallo-hydrolase [Streptomyces niphimycinicus]
MQQITLGDVTITRVEEYYGSVDMTPRAFFPESPERVWEDNASWLAPDFYDPAADNVRSAIQTWVLRSEGKTILVDTGVGNHKHRPYAPVWGYLNTDFLGNLARAGVRPEDVDVVINTHLHVDHVGWNTRLDGRQWVPTFPNATYLMPERDFEFWNPENEHKTVFGRGNQNVFEDSVAPIQEAGKAVLWDGTLDIDANLRLELAPGHTPGSSVLALDSRGDRALFVGDMLHNPVQIADPDTNSCFCEDPAESRATRRRILGRAAEENTLVFPAHLGGHGAAEVRHEGGGFAVKEWAAFARL